MPAAVDGTAKLAAVDTPGRSRDHRRHRRGILAGCWVLVAVLAGCGGSAATPTTSTPALFRVGTINYIDSLNPFVGYETQSYNAYDMLYPQLVQYDAKQRLVGDWATSWSTNPAGTVWTFHLRSGGRWSDGVPLTAEDAVWTGQLILRYAKGPTALLAGFLSGIKSFRAPNPTTLVITYSRPVGDALAQMVGFWVLPRHVWQRYVGTNGTGLKAYFPQQHLPVVSGGPFTMSQFQQKGTTVFRSNPYFYGPRAHVRAVTLTYYTNATSMIADFDAGNLDAIDQVPYEAVSHVKSESAVRVTTAPGSNIPALLFNSNPAKPRNRELLDPRVKTALEYAIDRAPLINVLWRGYAIPWANIVTRLSGSFVNQAIQPLPFDPAKANQILDALGYRRGAGGIRVIPATGGGYPQPAHQMNYTIAVPTDLDFNGDRAFQMLAADWAKIGVHVTEVSAGDTSQAYTYYYGPNTNYTSYDIGLWYYAGYIDPNFILSILTKAQWGNWNDTGYNNPAYDQLYAQQLRTVDQAKRAVIVKHMQQIINTDKPYIFLVNEEQVTATTAKWRGFNPNLYATSKTYFTDVQGR